MTVHLVIGDCRTELESMAAESVHCVVCSPPYWGLRDYNVDGQIGLEKDPNDYIANLVSVFRGVRRVLRKDGTLWLNMGDTFTDSGRGADTNSTLQGSRKNQAESRKVKVRNGTRPFGLGYKQMLLMPARLAIALQEDGWVCRMDIVWAKGNPMPESVNDRPTKSHEYMYLFAKHYRYFYDKYAIMDDVSGTAHVRGSGVGLKSKVPTGWATDTGRRHDEKQGRYHAKRVARPGSRARLNVKQNESFQSQVVDLVAQKNKRSVWTINPSPFKGAHFATFPPALIEPCILAGTSPRACELCGAPWRPVYSEPMPAEGMKAGNKQRQYRQDRGGPASNTKRQAHSVPYTPQRREIVDWKRTCDCELATGTGKCVVLDPFAGAGTTGLVAERLGRDSILIELNNHYADMARRRILNDPQSNRLR